MAEEDRWQVKSACHEYYGEIYRNGARVWFCSHRHWSAADARACAREKLKSLQERKT